MSPRAREHAAIEKPGPDADHLRRRVRELLSPSRVPLAWLSLATMLTVLLLHTWNGSDIWDHLSLGSRILETGRFQPDDALLIKQESYVNVYWLFQIICETLYRAGGVVGVSL